MFENFEFFIYGILEFFDFWRMSGIEKGRWSYIYGRF